jgi:hypothetical protein
MQRSKHGGRYGKPETKKALVHFDPHELLKTTGRKNIVRHKT